MGLTYKVRPAVPSDSALIMGMLRELMVAQGVDPDQVVEITEEDLQADSFGEGAFCHCLVVEAAEEGAPAETTRESTLVGYAIYIMTYSSRVGRTVFLEDIYLKPAHRGKGVGKDLISRVAKIGAEKGCKAMEWFVLETNHLARGFYSQLKAVDMTEEEGWRVMVSNGQNFLDLANQAATK